LQGRGPYDALMIPDAAIGADQAERFVYVVDEAGVAQRRPIELGRRIGEHRIVASGLEPDDVVIVDGLQRVRAGSAVAANEVKVAEPDLHGSAIPGQAK
jgi:multidrug efflux pump subunit AcrA (membrane-fusion protein)